MEVNSFKNQVWDLLRSISENMDRAFCPFTEKEGLTMMQARALIEVGQCGSHTVGSLGRRLGIASANASVLCKRLEQEGLLTRIRGDKDERMVHLAMTPFGSEVPGRMEQSLRNQYHDLFPEKDTQMFQTILEGLRSLNSLLEQMGNNQPRNKKEEMK